MWTPSDDSGVTIPGENVWRNTACGASFYTFDSERYQMVTDFQRLRDMAAHVPYDYIYVLSNTQKYGGGGIFNFYGISAAHHPTRTGKSMSTSSAICCWGWATNMSARPPMTTCTRKISNRGNPT